MKSALLILLTFVVFRTTGQAQPVSRDSVKVLFKIMRNAEEHEKVAAAVKLEGMLAEFYLDVENFDLEFDSLPFLGQISSPDGIVKMTCWNLAFDNGNFKYYSILRHRIDKKSVVVTVFDDNEDWQRIERKSIRPNKWYGALYYRILSNRYKGKTYYTILGWDGNNNITNRKVVDVISFQGKSVLLGSSIFKDMNGRPAHRLVFEYANDASMALNYDEKEKMIVMDHLAPEDSRFEGQYQFYGPDFSYDGLQFKKGEWNLLRDVFAKNRSLNNLSEEAKPGDFSD